MSDRVGAGFDHSCAVSRTGTVRCWGSNRFGSARLRPHRDHRRRRTATAPPQSSLGARTPARYGRCLGSVLGHDETPGEAPGDVRPVAL
ncbi:MAG: RCC1 domain-containing protein, partial [Acidimicrobiia bacterium]|nr:RCC1 domain-containing protein [Acidimicrobiia bacterium]